MGDYQVLSKQQVNTAEIQGHGEAGLIDDSKEIKVEFSTKKWLYLISAENTICRN